MISTAHLTEMAVMRFWEIDRSIPREVKGHDFPGPEVPRAYPYGIYDLGRNPYV